MNGLIGRTISHYRLLEQIGQGGMSSVFLASDSRDQRRVAIKVLSPYLANEAQFHARFKREIQLLRRLQHPNIIPILDFGEADGLAYIVMPYLASGTLHQRLLHGPLAPVEGGRIIEELASALTFAHKNGVIHRDVKPSNVLLDDHGHALLSDFSFSRSQDASQNLTGSALIGTPAYMSPEQCRGEPIDVRSDQYSFAVMLYQITTGQLPFEGETPMAVAIKHVNTPLPRPREVNPNLPVGIELVLIRALAKDPALRFASIEELNRAFQAALGAALDPLRPAAGAKTQNLENTLAMYRRYQNVKPPARRRASDRSAVVAALLLVLTCTISAAAIAVIYPDLFATARAASPMAAGDIQATVDVVLTANAPAAGTVLVPGAMETAVYEAVLQTLQASEVTEDEVLGPLALSDSWTATPSLPADFVFPTDPATLTDTPPIGGTPFTPTRTPTRTRTATRTRTPAVSATQGPSPTLAPASATQASTQTASAAPSSPTPTTAATATPSSIPPTNTPPPPTNTSPPPTSTSPPPPSATSAPTATVVEVDCGDYDLGNWNRFFSRMRVDISNYGSSIVRIVVIDLDWPASNGDFDVVRLRGGTIWDAGENNPPTHISSNWKGNRYISAGNTDTLELDFSDPAASSGYSLEVTFDNGCSVSDSE